MLLIVPDRRNCSFVALRSGPYRRTKYGSAKFPGPDPGKRLAPSLVVARSGSRDENICMKMIAMHKI